MKHYTSVFMLIITVVFSSISNAADPEEIQRAITELGDQEFQVREKASVFLWHAGDAALPVLKKAAKSSDPETAIRAGEILEKIEEGILPGMPENISSLILQYRKGSQNTKLAVIQNLLNDKEHGPQAVIRLLSNNHNENDLNMMFRRHSKLLLDLAVTMIAKDQFDDAETLLRTGAEADIDKMQRSFAVFLLINEDIDEEIKKRSEEYNGNPVKARILVRLYRARGQNKEALIKAQDTQSGNLIKFLLSTLGEWKKLEEIHNKNIRPDNIEWLGYQAFYQRLAGNTNEFQATIAKIQEFGKNNSGESWYAAEALLLNDLPDKAIDLLV
ncbi:hypothetical protein ACFLS1_04140 [Verrucomicrobiota bacterium]